jgi:hypothetical protein
MDSTRSRPLQFSADGLRRERGLGASPLATVPRWLATVDRRVMSVSVPTWAVALGVSTLGIYALVLYFRADLVLAFDDAVGHVYIARRAIDSLTPGFAQLGTVWLPWPHILMLPFVWNDTLWRTGLAGSIVSLVAFVLSALYIYRTVYFLSGSGLAGVAGAALFATNPNLLYMQATPMAETLTLFFIIATTYHLIRWAGEGSLTQLVLSSTFALGGTLTRYEAWWLVPCGAAIVVIGCLRRYGLGRQVEGLTLAWVILPAYGIVLWFVYNQIIFHDAFAFLGMGSAQQFARELNSLGMLPAKGHPIGAAILYGWSVIDVAGVPLVLAGLAGFAALLVSRLPLAVKCATLLPASLFLFEIVSLSGGQSAMLSPHSQVPGVVNTRYALVLLPAVVIAAGALARPLRSWGVLLLVVALLPQLAILPTPAGLASVRERIVARAALPGYMESWRESNFPLLRKDEGVLLEEAVGIQDRRHQNIDATASWLREYAGSGLIMIALWDNAPGLMLESGFPLSRFIYVGNHPLFEEEQTSPGLHSEWIVYRPEMAHGEVSVPMVEGHPPGFRLVFQEGNLEIFHRVSGAARLE